MIFTETNLQEWLSVNRMKYRRALRRRKEEWTREWQKTEEKIRDLIIMLQLFKKIPKTEILKNG